MSDSEPTPDASDADDEPSLKQRLHAATGDRDREAEALAERSGDDVDVDVDDARVAVNRAHGESPESVDTASAHASPEDAERARRDRSD